MKDFSFITNSHPAYIEGLYQDFVKNPDTVDPDFRRFFEGFDFAVTQGKSAATLNGSKGTPNGSYAAANGPSATAAGASKNIDNHRWGGLEKRAGRLSSHPWLPQ